MSDLGAFPTCQVTRGEGALRLRRHPGKLNCGSCPPRSVGDAILIALMAGGRRDRSRSSAGLRHMVGI